MTESVIGADPADADAAENRKMSDTPVKSRKRSWFVWIGLALLLGLGVAGYLSGMRLPSFSGNHSDKTPVAERTRLKVELVREKDVPAHTLVVPEDVRISLGIRTKNGKDMIVAAEPPPAHGNRPLTLSGSIMYDPATVYPIHARFTPAKVTSISTIKVFRDDTYEERELRTGDFVKAGSVLAVFESVDVGVKKNDLIDAVVSMKLDKELLDTADGNAALPLVMKLLFRQKVEADQNAINRAISTLELWEIPKEDIDAAYEEAKNIIKNSAEGRRENRKNAKWARVELKAPADGTIIERTVSENELIQDPTRNLFQIAKVDKVLVQINAHEDELRELIALKPEERKWKIRPYGSSDFDEIDGNIEEIGLLVDPAQHTIPLRGRIVNKDKFLRGGQYVTATIKLDPPKDVVEIPSSAVVDDGREAVVFVQDPKNPSYFSMRRVHVTYRFENRVFVSSKLSDKEMELTQTDKDQSLLPKRPLHPGERLITAGLLELKKELEDREADLGE